MDCCLFAFCNFKDDKRLFNISKFKKLASAMSRFDCLGRLLNFRERELVNIPLVTSYILVTSGKSKNPQR